MLVFDSNLKLKTFLEQNLRLNQSVGFVPTMGALHDGHLSLVKKAIVENDLVVISIFVNPTQFNNKEDLIKYPKDIQKDIQKIESLSSKVIVFTPSADEIYQGKIESQHFNFDGIENQMEGKFRPGHFDGVGTIVKKLFSIIQPNKAYFGEKDFQQLQIVKKLVEKENLNVNIIGCPVFREKNGLAMSSRNERLNPAERKNAAMIYRALKMAKKEFKVKSSKQVLDLVLNVFNQQTQFQLEYFQIADETQLSPCIRKSKHKKYRAFIAVLVNNIRLIDTISLN
jgi:pantoate--beta-alanine ligase